MAAAHRDPVRLGTLAAVAIALLGRRRGAADVFRFVRSVRSRIVEGRDADRTGIFSQEVFSDASALTQETVEIDDSLPSADRSALRTISKIKNAILGLKGFVSTVESQELNGSNSDDDRTQRTERSLTLFKNEKTQTEEYIRSVDESISVAVDFLTDTFLKNGQNYIIYYLSEILGELIDVLCEMNLYLPSFDSLVKTSDDIFHRIMKNDRFQSKAYRIDLELFFLLNKSQKMIQYNFSNFDRELETFLKSIGTPEMQNGRLSDRLYSTLNMSEEFLNVSRKKKLASETWASSMRVAESGEVFEYMSQNFQPEGDRERSESVSRCVGDFLDALNRTVVACIDHFPLVSFRAMEMINKHTDASK